MFTRLGCKRQHIPTMLSTMEGANARKNQTHDNLLNHNGILSCFFQGFSNALFRNFLRPKAIRRRVECG